MILSLSAKWRAYWKRCHTFSDFMSSTSHFSNGRVWDEVQDLRKHFRPWEGGINQQPHQAHNKDGQREARYGSYRVRDFQVTTWLTCCTKSCQTESRLAVASFQQADQDRRNGQGSIKNLFYRYQSQARLLDRETFAAAQHCRFDRLQTPCRCFEPDVAQINTEPKVQSPLPKREPNPEPKPAPKPVTQPASTPEMRPKRRCNIHHE